MKNWFKYQWFYHVTCRRKPKPFVWPSYSDAGQLSYWAAKDEIHNMDHPALEAWDKLVSSRIKTRGVIVSPVHRKWYPILTELGIETQKDLEDALKAITEGDKP